MQAEWGAEVRCFFRFFFIKCKWIGGDLGSPSFFLRKFPLRKRSIGMVLIWVQQELQKGNSYLLNLTYATEIQTNYTLTQLFKHSRAKYKVIVW